MATQKRRFGRPKKRNLNQQEIKDFLLSINFSPAEISQPWRHLTAIGKYQNKPAVFKLASTQTTSIQTRNEYYWNQAVHLTSKSQRTAFLVPKNYISGYRNKLFYFISRYFPGETLEDKLKNNPKKFSPLIPQIAQAAFQITYLSFPSTCNFLSRKPAKSNQRTSLPIGHRLLVSATEWASQVPQDLNPFLKIMEQSKDKLNSAPAHGDFVVRHMYQVNSQIGIIDGEHAGARGPKYYDVAQFYLRLRNDHQAQELAAVFLRKFQKHLSRSGQQTFWEELKPVLIQRYIGDLWGAAKDPKKLKNLRSLGREILANKII